MVLATLFNEGRVMEQVLRIALPAAFVLWGVYVVINREKVNQEWFLSKKGTLWIGVSGVAAIVCGIALAAIFLGVLG